MVLKRRVVVSENLAFYLVSGLLPSLYVVGYKSCPDHAGYSHSIFRLISTFSPKSKITNFEIFYLSLVILVYNIPCIVGVTHLDTVTQYHGNLVIRLSIRYSNAVLK